MNWTQRRRWVGDKETTVEGADLLHGLHGLARFGAQGELSPAGRRGNRTRGMHKRSPVSRFKLALKKGPKSEFSVIHGWIPF